MTFSTSSPTYPASVSVVASATANGTSKIQDKIVSQIELNIPTFPKENLPKELSSIKPVKV